MPRLTKEEHLKFLEGELNYWKVLASISKGDTRKQYLIGIEHLENGIKSMKKGD